MTKLTDCVSFGGGVQSTAIMVLAGEGLIPLPDHWVFSDPGFETTETYAHVERCKDYLAKHGRTLNVISVGNISTDAIDFAERPSENSGLKRWASIPMFTDGEKPGILPRQCTSEYKIEPIEQYHRREIMGLQEGQRAPKTPQVCVWIGFSIDEERRAKPPGRWKKIIGTIGEDLFGDDIKAENVKWMPQEWLVKAHPLLGYQLWPDRSRVDDDRFDYCAGWDRQDALDFLAKTWPHPVPRSACICCPYRSNEEWRLMRDKSPDDWQRAVKFDEDIRYSYTHGQNRRGKPLASKPFIHRSRVPLGMAPIDEPTKEADRRRGCGSLFGEPFEDGMCGT
jgi:hypothetical protein